MNELLKPINYKYVCTRKEIVALLKLVDSNGDQRLSINEFVDLVDTFVQTKEWTDELVISIYVSEAVGRNSQLLVLNTVEMSGRLCLGMFGTEEDCFNKLGIRIYGIIVTHDKNDV